MAEIWQAPEILYPTVYPYKYLVVIYESILQPWSICKFKHNRLSQGILGMEQRKLRDSVLWLSLGENCLPDDILKRHGRKSFSTPFSSGRTNIDYALELEKENFCNLLIKDNLCYGDAWGTRVVRSTYITKADDIYDVSCARGFEFTHHNLIESQKDLDSYHRKVQRLIAIRNRMDVVFLYHHRRNDKSDFNKLIQKLCDFRLIYSTNNSKAYIVLFHQSIVHQKDERRLEIEFFDERFLEFKFHTEYVWGGNDSIIFYARNDEDLVTEMFKKIDAHFAFIKGGGVSTIPADAKGNSYQAAEIPQNPSTQRPVER